METLAGDWFLDVTFPFGYNRSDLLHSGDFGGKTGKFPRLYRGWHRAYQQNP